MKTVRVNRAFWIIMIFFMVIFGVFSVSKTAYSYNSPKEHTEIDDINRKIAELEDMKKGYEARAIKHANTADRLQFIEGQLQLAKKHWKLSAESKKIAEKIQTQIDELEAQKQQILKKKNSI